MYVRRGDTLADLHKYSLIINQRKRVNAISLPDRDNAKGYDCQKKTCQSVVKKVVCR